MSPGVAAQNEAYATGEQTREICSPVASTAARDRVTGRTFLLEHPTYIDLSASWLACHGDGARLQSYTGGGGSIANVRRRGREVRDSCRLQLPSAVLSYYPSS